MILPRGTTSLRSLPLLLLLLLTQVFLLPGVHGANPVCPGSSRQKHWMYALQAGTKQRLLSVAPSAKYIVTDYTYDGLTPIPRRDVQSLKNIIPNSLSYLSIGEAETYRYYWKPSWGGSPPGWLGAENPEWQGNYKVRYWDAAWQRIVFGYVDKIVAAGWAGVYLDIIDGYEYWSDEEQMAAAGEKGQPLEVSDAAKRMIKFVVAIAARARKTNPSFQVFPQNAAEIIQWDTTGVYMTTVNGIGAESVFYEGFDKATDTAARLKYLRKFREKGKTVLSVDYVDDGSGCSGANKQRVAAYLKSANKEGFIPFPSNEGNRELTSVECPCLG